MRNVFDKSFRENQNTHFMFNKFPPPRKSCHLWGDVEKYCTAGQATDDSIVDEHCILYTGYRHTLRICYMYNACHVAYKQVTSKIPNLNI